MSGDRRCNVPLERAWFLLGRDGDGRGIAGSFCLSLVLALLLVILDRHPPKLLQELFFTFRTMPVCENAYFARLIQQVDRILEKNRTLAAAIGEAYTWLLRISACLHYPPKLYVTAPKPTRHQVKQEMEALLKSFESEARAQRILLSLYTGLQKRWELFGDDLLHCFEIPGLPQDNRKVENLFGQLRSHQRRISGRKSTQPLRDFGHYQILFGAESEEQLLEQLRRVPVQDYQQQRKHQAQAEAPRKFLARLHRDPGETMRVLAEHYTAYLPTSWSVPSLSNIPIFHTV